MTLATDIFNETEQTSANTDDILNQYVGEGKKYSSPEDLAKAYQNADTFINQLKEETAGLRQELDKRLNAEEMVEQIKREREELKASAATQENTTPKLDEEVLSKLISNTFEQKEAEKAQQSNINVVDQKMKAIYGEDKAKEVFQSKAQSLGLSNDFLMEVAAKSPDAFFNVLGISAEGGKTSTPAPTVGTTNTAAVENLQAGNAVQPDTWEDFEQLRKSNPRKYFTPEVQNRLMKARTEKGPEGFYK